MNTITMATKTSEVEATPMIMTTTTAIPRNITTTVATLLSRCQEAVEDAVALTHLHTEVGLRCCIGFNQCRCMQVLSVWVQFSLLSWTGKRQCFHLSISNSSAVIRA